MFLWDNTFFLIVCCIQVFFFKYSKKSISLKLSLSKKPPYFFCTWTLGYKMQKILDLPHTALALISFHILLWGLKSKFSLFQGELYNLEYFLVWKTFWQIPLAVAPIPHIGNITYFGITYTNNIYDFLRCHNFPPSILLAFYLSVWQKLRLYNLT